MVVDLSAQLDRQAVEKLKIERMMRELLDAKRLQSSERLSPEQLALFEAMWQARQAGDAADQDQTPDDEQDPPTPPAAGGSDEAAAQKKNRGGRRPLAKHLERQRIVHDLAEADKHCAGCGETLRPIGEDTSERYEYVPASLTVVEDVCLKYACQCTVHTAGKPPQPIEKSTAGASVLAQVIVAKFADHLPLYRQEQMWASWGVEPSRKTMGGLMAQSAALLEPLYAVAHRVLLESKVIGTDDTSVKVLDPSLDFARIGRFWPYLGDAAHPVVIFDYTATRERAGPERFLAGFRGYLQADAYAAYDAFFKSDRGMTEVGCWMHARRYVFKALESDPERMGPALALIARLYECEEVAAEWSAAERYRLRQKLARPVLRHLHEYLVKIRPELLPSSPAFQAVRYALNQWEALTRYLDDGDLSIDNGATERVNRAIAVGRGNWLFLGSDTGGKTAAVLATFVASCKRAAVNPFVWFKDVLGRIGSHPVNRLEELLPHNWKLLSA